MHVLDHAFGTSVLQIRNRSLQAYEAWPIEEISVPQQKYIYSKGKASSPTQVSHFLNHRQTWRTPSLNHARGKAVAVVAPKYLPVKFRGWVVLKSLLHMLPFLKTWHNSNVCTFEFPLLWYLVSSLEDTISFLNASPPYFIIHLFNSLCVVYVVPTALPLPLLPLSLFPQRHTYLPYHHTLN